MLGGFEAWGLGQVFFFTRLELGFVGLSVYGFAV